MPISIKLGIAGRLFTAALACLTLAATVPTGRLGSTGYLFIQSTSPEVPLYVYTPIPESGLEPRNIHLSFGDNETSVVVTWSTRNDTQSQVQLMSVQPPNATEKLYNGSSMIFVDSGTKKATQYVHRVTLPDLGWGGLFKYRCGSQATGWSDWFEFRTPKRGFSPRLAMFGDMGMVNAQSLPRLMQDASAGMYDAILHVGDFAYDMQEQDGATGDQFMQMIQPIAARLPYMTCVGNHEFMYNFSHYKNRFTMPKGFGGDGESMFYSFDLGPAHIIGISTEFYFFVEYGVDQLKSQYDWLQADLERASKNRAARPWIIIMGHRPMYCSNDDGDDCTFGALFMREGFLARWYPLEPLLQKYGVDLALWAHEHTYERMWPVTRLEVRNGSWAEPYSEPRGTVHVVTGSAGCRERHDTFGSPMYYSAFRSTDYGYTRMQIFNSTHLSLEQVSDDQQGRIIDRITIVQHNHGPFP
ncbi:hypothetical protein BOX15_Mlig013175g4 [Macrostomum lignano]|uniref:Purple acid phosphatase n=2 Tax=Macrostomum lignano TaxID=282301 RepID=A0A267G173_9PLAT|nr:hypothetical protein BOX15_Mlig013175g4 [Macrostomum lignano]